MTNIAIENGTFIVDLPISLWFVVLILVGGNPTPLKNMSSSVGMMKFHENPNWMDK